MAPFSKMPKEEFNWSVVFASAFRASLVFSTNRLLMPNAGPYTAVRSQVSLVSLAKDTGMMLSERTIESKGQDARELDLDVHGRRLLRLVDKSR